MKWEWRDGVLYEGGKFIVLQAPCYENHDAPDVAHVCEPKPVVVQGGLNAALIESAPEMADLLRKGLGLLYARSALSAEEKSWINDATAVLGGG